MKIWDSLKRGAFAVFTIVTVITLAGCSSIWQIKKTGDPATGWSVHPDTNLSTICFNEHMVDFIYDEDDLPIIGTVIPYHSMCQNSKIEITHNPKTGWKKLPEGESYTKYEICYNEKNSTVLYIPADEEFKDDFVHYWTMTSPTGPDVDCS